MIDKTNIFFAELTTEDRLSKAKIKLNKSFPFFAYIVEHLRFKEVNTPQVQTMGVDIKGNCYYNKTFVDKLPEAQLMGVLCHEVQHPALRHFQRQGHRNILVNGGSLWNVAIDIANNYLLVQNGLELPPEGIIPSGNSVVVFNVTIDNLDIKSAEEIYEELLAGLEKNGAKKVKGQGGQEQGQSGQGGGDQGDEYESSGKAGSFDQHIKDGVGEEEGEGKGKDGDKEEGEGQGGAGDKEGEGVPNVDWDKVVAEAFNHAKMIGKSPAGFDRYFEELHAPKVNWRTLLRKTIASFLPYDYTYRRPNKKYSCHDIYMPSIYGESIRVICSIDTSGSISQKDLEAYISEMIGISKSFSNVEFRVLTHDTDVHDDIPIYNGHVNKIKQLQIHGGGGTSHIPLYEHIEKNRRKWNTNLLVSFTDGYSAFPDKRPGIETIFVLSGGHCPKENMPAWSRKVVCLD